MVCSHSTNSPISGTIYKDECTLCFQSQDSPDGVDVCLTCFNGSCASHSTMHFSKTGHKLYMNIHRIVDSSPPTKITKLEIQDTKGTEYTFQTKFKCLGCHGSEAPDGFERTVESILKATSAKRESELKAWQDELVQTCYHTADLIQAGAKLEGRALAHCNSCDLKDNLWMCLTCGNLGCGRAQFGGTAGNGHAMSHFESCNHPVAVKMGSITPEGTADIFCYEHGTEILDSKLSSHLAHFGINIDTQEKTIKSIAEMQLDQNVKFDFSMTTDDGTELEPLEGPGLTGLENLGNSCYMASVLQTVFSLKPFQEQYYKKDHISSCSAFPATCFNCQMAKVANGLLSGDFQSSISPSMFKTLVGKGSPEFSSMKQQDAQEFLQYLLNMIDQKERSPTSPSKCLTYSTEARVQCLECEHVQYQHIESSSIILRIPAIPNLVEGKKVYQPVILKDCIDSYFEADIREFQCSVDQSKTSAVFTQKLETFPQYLILVASRFVLGENWVIEKLNVDLEVPMELDLAPFRASGVLEDEKLFPIAQNVVQDVESLNQLLAMGFPEARCLKALEKTGNNGADAAMNWLFEHMEDTAEAEQDLTPLIEMGFTEKQAKKAMQETGDNMERALDWLFSHPAEDVVEVAVKIDQGAAKYKLHALISHKGPSAQCGHYVSYICKDGEWVLFNDRKVARVPDITIPAKQAYVYVYERV